MMTNREIWIFICGALFGSGLMLAVLTWIAGHKELTEAFTGNVRKFWARLTRNFGEKEEPEYKDAHADHVGEVKRFIDKEPPIEYRDSGDLTPIMGFTYKKPFNYSEEKAKDVRIDRNKDLYHN